jgi:hypothetical protein
MMSNTQDRLRDAATALGSTLQAADIPPLRLPDATRPSRATGRRPGRPAFGRWLVPLATAVAVIAILALVVVVRSLPDRPHPASGAAQLVRWPVRGQAGWTAWSETGRQSGKLVTDAVAASGPGSAWVFATDPGTRLRPIAWRLSGSGWARVHFPGRRGEDIDALDASSPADAWVFTSANRALHWDGQAWRVVPGFPGRHVGSALVIGPSDVWVFGNPYTDVGLNGSHTTWHFNGQAWTRVGTAAWLQYGSSTSARDIWAAGGNVIGHWNGTAWDKVSVAGLLPPRTQYCGPLVTDIDAVSAADAWAMGWQGCQDTGGQAVLLHYAGGRWHRVARLGQVSPDAILRAGNGEAWIQLDPDPQQPGHVKVMHYANGTLHQVAMPLLSQIINPSETVLPDGTSFLAGAHNLGRHRTTGFVLRYQP